MITGFRFYGGAKTFYGVEPDLLTTGKAVGGQYFPGAGAICGKAEIMELIDHIRRPRFWERVFHGGTFTGNALSMRAGYTLIEYLREHRDEVYSYLDSLGKRLRNGLDEVFSDAGLAIRASGVGSITGIHFTDVEPLSPSAIGGLEDREMALRFFKHMLDRGFAFLLPRAPNLFVSTAHTAEEIDMFVNAAEEFARREAGGKF